MGFFKKDYIVGLDIGSSSVKLAQFIDKDGALHLIRADLKEFSSSDDKAANEKEILCAFKELLKGVAIKQSKFILSINSLKTAVTKVNAPYMPKGELREAILLAAKNYFPFPLDKALLDFKVLGEKFERGVKTYQVLVAVSPRESVDRLVSLLHKAGIKPLAIVPSCLTLQKLIERMRPNEDRVDSVLEIGRSFSELTIFRAGDFLFSRKIHVAGDDFTKALMTILVSDRGKTALSLEEAERIKKDVGIPPESESRIVEDKIATSQIFSMLRSPLEQLVSEIERCFDYYREEVAGKKVDSLLLVGGGAGLNGLKEFLSGELGIEVDLCNPLGNLKIGATTSDIERKELFYRLAPAVGAALDTARVINLLPPEIKEETKRTFKRATVQAVVTAAALIMVFMYIGMKIQLTNFQKKLSVAKMELSSLEPQLNRALEQLLVNRLLVDEPYWEDVFRELSNIVSADVCLTGLTMQNKTLRMRGIIGSGEKEALLSSFISALEKGIFKDVKLVTMKEIKERSVNEFELECWVE